MLRTHLRECEKALKTQGQIAAAAGHTLNRGNPRENFIETFLEHHLPSTLDIGTGEIIDCHSKPRESRNQHDIVIFQRTFPRLHFGGTSYGFLVESVSATIEVKSLLDKDAMRQAIQAAYRVKHLDVGAASGIQIGGGCRIFSGVVAYEGPANMETVAKWAIECEKELGIVDEETACKSIDGKSVRCPSIDSILVLGKGVVYNKNYGGLSFRESVTAPWISVESDQNDNLLLFFVQLMQTLSTLRMDGSSLIGYVSPISYTNIKLVEYGTKGIK